mgnify:FL=1
MRLSEKWIKEIVNVDDTIENIAEKMVFCGNEYESINKLCPATNLVVGRVVSVHPHPDSDHLNLCEVDLGDKIYQIICGAPNVSANIKVIVAKVGAKLPGGVIESRSVRGVLSNGMICSLAELGLENKYLTEEDKKGIHILSDDAPVGIDALSYLMLDDTYIDFELTANRSDLLSMRGMSYEIGAIYNKKFNIEIPKLNESIEKTKDYIEIENKTNNCYAYKGRIVKNVEIKESPEFIKSRLMSCGIRPINNVVDISNYVMMLYGEPLHFFDYNSIGKKVIIRNALDGEKITTLDNIKRTLKDTDIVISDEISPIALAGVMGGVTSEVTNNTKDIFIEAALFNPYNIRYTSKRILRSEASIRFEKGVDPNILSSAIDMAAYLLQEYASGTVLSGVVGFNDMSLDDKEINISIDKITSVLGMNISIDDVKDIFDRLAFTYKEANGEFKVYVPTRRLDINIKEDLIEEVGRIYGYNNMEGIMPVTRTKKGSLLPKNKYIKDIKNRLSALSLNEVITYSLVNKEDVKKFNNDEFNEIKVSSPLNEDRSILRYSLVPSLLKVVDYNISRNIKDVNIFEVSKVYYNTDSLNEINKLCFVMTGNYIENSWGSKVKVDFYLIKGILLNLLNYLGLSNRCKLVNDNLPKEYHPGISGRVLIDNKEVGYIGKIHPNESKNDIYICELNLDVIYNINIKNIKYKEIPKYPSVIKDLAFILNNNINAIDVIDEINSSSRLISNTTVFDVFNLDNNSKSVAFKITFTDITKTLNEDEVNHALNTIIKNIETKFNAVLRDK